MADQHITDGSCCACVTCQHPPILHRTGWCAVTETPWDGGRGRKCPCDFYVEPLRAERVTA
jgi:hypothetical protein